MEKKKARFLNVLNIGLLFFIISVFISNPINAQAYFNPGVGYGGVYGPTSWRTPVADFLAGYGISSYSTGSPYYPLYPPYNYGLYHGNPYNPNDPLYGTVAPPPISIPSGIMNMLLTSRYSPNEPDMSYLGYQLSLPYFQAALTSGWTPFGYQRYYPSYPFPGIPYGNDFGTSPFGYQRYYPSYPFPGIPYGSDMVGYP